MSVTVAAVGVPNVVGHQRKTVTDVTMDNNYASGGEPLTVAQVGLGIFDYAVCNIKSTSGGGINVASAYYDGALLHLWDETPAEVSGTGDVSTTVVRVEAWGR